MSPRIGLAACGLTACLLFGAAVQAQEADQFYGQPVAEVLFEVEGPAASTASLTGLVDVRAGLPLTRERVRESLAHLSSRYDQVRVIVGPSAAGLVVTFRLVPRYPINRVEIATGGSALESCSPGAELSQQFAGLSTGLRLDAVEDATRRILNDCGYLSPEVSATTVVEPEATRATLRVSVSPGPLSVIEHSEIEGSSLVSAAEVRRRTETAPGRPFRRRQIETGLTDIEDDLRSRGYYEAQASLRVTPAPRGVNVTVFIDSGPRVELRVQPADALPGGVDELIPVRRLRSVDQDLLEDSRLAIERALRREGFASASAPFERQFSPDRSLMTITFMIQRGPRYYVDRIDLSERPELPPSEIRARLQLRPTDVFDQETFERGVAQVIEEYRRLGYYRSRAEPTRQLVPDRSNASEAWVVLDPGISAGPRGQITDIAFTFAGDQTVPEGDLRALMRSRVGAPYLELEAVLDQDAVVAFYRARGFLSAAVELAPRISDDGTRVALSFTIDEGPKIVVGRVTVTGNERVSEQQILEVLDLSPSQPLSVASLNAARQRLFDMGVFRNVSVTAEDRLSGETEAHVLVNVTEAATITGGFGGGLEGGSRSRSLAGGGQEDFVEFKPRGFFEINRRNIGGRNRSLGFFSRVSLKPRSTPDVPETDGRGFGFSEYRVAVTYRERRAFRSNTDVLVGATTEQAVRSSYTSLRRGLNAEFLRRPTARVSVSGRYGLDFTRLFDERIKAEDQPLIDRLFPQVRLSFLAGGSTWDGRDSILAPTRGTFLSADAEVAVRALGSEVGYVKTFFQASNFRRLGQGPATVLAVRAQLGAAHGFSREVTSIGQDGPTIAVVQDLPVSQRFFAGGSTTVRGFQYDRLGTFDPACAACSVIDRNTGLSFGGNAVLVVNAELRRIVGRVFDRNFALAGFLAGGNVFDKAADLDPARIRGAAGFGARWDSPLGPLRLDFGFKLDRLEIAGRRESAWEYHLSIGEAF